MRFTPFISCEHASNRVPSDLDRLGLGDADLEGHHAWDPGAEHVANAIADALGAPRIIAEWSRLVADLNRPNDVPQVVPQIAFGLQVPGNQRLSDVERAARIERYHTPYWSTAIGRIRELVESNPDAAVLHVSIHSFTPKYRGVVRPMSIGVMFDPERELEAMLAPKMMERIEERGLVAAENLPYDGRAPALVTSTRELIEAPRYAGIELEINQRHLGELDRISTILLDAIRFSAGWS